MRYDAECCHALFMLVAAFAAACRAAADVLIRRRCFRYAAVADVYADAIAASCHTLIRHVIRHAMPAIDIFAMPAAGHYAMLFRHV